MQFEDSFRAAAKAAADATLRAMRKYREGLVTDEDDLTGVLVGNLDSTLDGRIEDITWSTSILRHRKGVAAEERRIGADMVLHVSVRTSAFHYSKGVLVQAKRAARNEIMTTPAFDELVNQCNKMLAVTPSSYVFDYTKQGIRCGSATMIASSTDRHLYGNCVMTPYRFFLDLFRCPIGDPAITSARVSDLPAPVAVSITGTQADGPRPRRRPQT